MARLTRRDFLKTASWAAIASALPAPRTADAGTNPVVVRVHHRGASRTWNYADSSPWNDKAEPRTADDMASGRFRKDRYFDFIDEGTVRLMFRRGLTGLVNAASCAEAWTTILKRPGPNDRITIKINLNNASYDERVTTNRMDQTAPLVNAIVAGLTEDLSLPQENITIADPSRWVHPEILRRRCPFPNVRWVDSRSADLWDPGETVRFTKDEPVRPDVPGMPERASFEIARVYTGADHIINVCLLKNHGCGVTGAMKNHFGAIRPPSPKFLHARLGEKSYIADLCNTPSIRDKVRLNVCDAVFGNWRDNVWCPRPWKTFPGHTPNSLFLGIDPVAFDSVLLQHITNEVAAQGAAAEPWVRNAVTTHQFLHYAMDHHRLGIHEHKPFRRIRYREIELA